MELRGHGEDDMARNSQKKLTKKTANTKGTGSASSKASAKKGSKPAAKKALKAPAKKAKKLAKIKSTGGYGFAFEDKVAGQLLIRMLDGLEPVEHQRQPGRAS